MQNATLHFWGAGLYGEWLVLAAFPAYLTISDLGFTSATSHEITMRVARADHKGALVAFQSTWAAITLLSVLVGCALIGGAWVVPLADWFGFRALDAAGAATVMGLLLFQVVVNIQTGLVAVGLVSAGQYGLHVFLSAMTRLVAFVIVLAVVAAGAGPLGAAIVLAATECVGFLVIAAFAHRYSSWLRYGWGEASLSTLRRLAGPSFGFALFVVGNAVQVQGPVLVIGALLGPTAVAVFSPLRMLARAVMMVANIAFNSIRPEIAMAYGVGDRETTRRLAFRAVQFALWLAVGAFVTLMIVGPWVVELWTAGRIHAQQPLFALLVASGMGTLLWTGAASPLYATNNNRAIAFAYVAVACLAVAGTALAVEVMGLDGAGLALALGECLFLVFVLARALAFLDQGFGQLCAYVVRPPTDLLSLLRR